MVIAIGLCSNERPRVRVRSDRHRRRGFTLVELIAVVVVLAVLAAVAVPVYFNHANQARITAYASHINTVRRTLRLFEAELPKDDLGYTLTVDTANYQSSPLTVYFTSNPFNAFGGDWRYTHWPITNFDSSTLSGVNLAPIGAFPAQANKFLQLIAGRDAEYTDSVSREDNFGNPPYNSVTIGSNSGTSTYVRVEHYTEGVTVTPSTPTIELWIQWRRHTETGG